MARATVIAHSGAGQGRPAHEPLEDLTAASPDLQALRDACEQLHGQFEMAAGVSVRPVIAGGVPSLLLSPRPGLAPTILLLHGGGYVMGSAFGYRHLASALAAAADACVIEPDYRLAPRAPVPGRYRGRGARLPLDARLGGLRGTDRCGGRLRWRRPRAVGADHAEATGSTPSRRRRRAVLATASGLLGQYTSNDPRIVAMGSSGLLGLYQQVTGIAQTSAYSQAFFVIALICFAGALFAVFLRSGKPTQAAAMAH